MACKKLTRLISLTEVFMKKFRIEPHGRLQEWVADEKGYFREEGLDYEFLTSYATQASGYALVQSTECAEREARGLLEYRERPRLRHQLRVSLGGQYGFSLGPRPHVGTRILRDPLGHCRPAGGFDQEAARPGRHRGRGGLSLRQLLFCHPSIGKD